MSDGYRVSGGYRRSLAVNGDSRQASVHGTPADSAGAGRDSHALPSVPFPPNNKVVVGRSTAQNVGSVTRPAGSEKRAKPRRPKEAS